jgi:hypothetical protein
MLVEMQEREWYEGAEVDALIHRLIHIVKEIVNTRRDLFEAERKETQEKDLAIDHAYEAGLTSVSAIDQFAKRGASVWSLTAKDFRTDLMQLIDERDLLKDLLEHARAS